MPLNRFFQPHNRNYHLLSKPLARLAGVMLAVMLALGLQLLFLSLAYAVNITVNTTADVVANDGQCSLREAITSANIDTASGAAGGECPAGSGADTITLPTGTYTLTIAGANEDANATGDFDITSNITLQGVTSSTTIINANNIDRIMHVFPGAVIALNDLTLRNGQATGSFGSAIYNNGQTTISNTLIANNLGLLGTVYNPPSRTLNVINSTFRNNNGNSGGSGRGGGIYADGGAVTIAGSLFDSNISSHGGAIAQFGGTLHISGSTIKNNLSTSGIASGGGVSVAGGSMFMTNTIVMSNTAALGGGIDLQFGNGTVRIVNALLARNSAPTGAAILVNNSSPNVQILHTTIASPTAASGAAIYFGSSFGGTAGITDTIVASHTTGIQRVAGTVTEDYNVLFGNTTNLVGTITSGGNSQTGNPQLQAPLCDIYKLGPGSPAIDTGVNAGVGFDFEGDPRPLLSGFDIGYDEAISTTFEVPVYCLSAANNSPTTLGNSTAFTATIAGGTNVTYEWNFGDGNLGVEATPSHTYGVAGNYTALVTATNIVNLLTATTVVQIIGPEMALLGNTQVITDGDTTPSLADHTDFGSITLGGAITRTFTISNSGNANLTLTGSPRVTITGPAALDFSLVASPTTPILSNTTTTFQVRFSPSVTGTRVATLTLANDDGDENPYDFAIQGVALPDLSLEVDRTDDTNAAAAQICADATPNDCSVRGAISKANADTSNTYTITLSAGTYTLALTGAGENANATGDLDITNNLTINGAGASTTIINANGLDRVIHIVQNGTININDLTITGGSASDGGGIFVKFSFSGAFNLTNVSIVSNTAIGGFGGGIFGNGTNTLNGVTIANNQAGGGGGGMYSDAGSITIKNSTISGNSANGDSGGIRLWDSGTVINTSIINNTADADNNGSGNGGGVGGSVTLQNSIVANNVDRGGQAPDCGSGTITSGNYNLVEDTTGCSYTPAGNDITGTDPLLAPLADNGGNTQTHALYVGSPALNQIPSSVNGCGTTITTDQRGVARPDGSACDIGAFEGSIPNNQTPVADAGIDQSVNTNALVTLNGTGSSDPDNNLPLSYGWTQTGGPAVTLSSATAVSPTFTAPGNPGVLTFTLTVTNSLSLADSTPDTVVITVDNQTPIADAGSNQSVNTNAGVTLDGTGSSDPDNDLPLTHGWTQTGGPAVTLSNSTASQPTFTAPGSSAVLTFTLTVTDSLGLADPTPDTVVITVNNQAPSANAGSDQNVSTGVVVTLNGSGSSDPDNHLPLSYRWTQTGGPAVTLSSTTTVSPTFTTPGSTTVLTFSLTVTDSLGLADPTPDEVVVAVSQQVIYLPLVFKNFTLGPDLVVESLSASGGVTLVIKNIGSAPVIDAFWLDVYFNPTQTPGLNKEWEAIAPAGAVWGVTKTLDPGESLTLTSGGAYYFPDQSSPSFPSGAQVYALVDSVNYSTTYGNVQESNESNNLFGPVVSAATADSGPPTAAGSEPSREGLPER